ncbi:hypothetical protein VE25_09800, partial [Devosia geojensis]
AYGALNALRDVSLQIADGYFAVFAGPSGCGGSPLLRLIARLDPVTGAAIAIGGTDLTAHPPAPPRVAIVFRHNSRACAEPT